MNVKINKIIKFRLLINWMIWKKMLKLINKNGMKFLENIIYKMILIKDKIIIVLLKIIIHQE